MSLPDFYPSTVDGLRLRDVLGRDDWTAPVRYGPDGWQIERHDRAALVLVGATTVDGHTVITASLGRPDGGLVTDDVATLITAVFPDQDAWELEVFADEHSGAWHVSGTSR